MKTIPLAPPAPVGPVERPKNSTAFQWTSWLSPKIHSSHPRPRSSERSTNRGRRDDDDYDASPLSSRQQQQQRPRRSSFDHTPGAAHYSGRLNRERGGQFYFGSISAPSSKTTSSDVGDGGCSRDMLSLSMSRSSDDGGNNNQQCQQSSLAASSNSRSLLTVFLLHLNSLLPEYCDHLSTASNSNILHSNNNGASKAVGVLERGAKTLSVTFGGANTTAHQHHQSPKSQSSSPTVMKTSHTSIPVPVVYPSTTSGVEGAHTMMAAGTTISSAPSSPSHSQGTTASATSSPTKNYLTPMSDHDHAGSPSKLADVRHWLSPLSPSRFRDNSYYSERNIRSKLSPTKKQQSSSSSGSSALKWNSIAESEWERFISPFFMLVGAECLYGKMEHVLDPTIIEKATQKMKNAGGESSTSKSATTAAARKEIDRKKKGATSFVKFAASMQSSRKVDASSEMAGESNSSENDRRGSRRLIAMYRQIREE